MTRPPIFLLPLLAASILGCVSRTATFDQVRDPAVPIGDMGAVAVFPPVDASYEPQEVHDLNRTIEKGIHRRHPDMKFVGDQEVPRVLEEQGLGEAWSRFTEAYRAGADPDGDLLGKLGSALGADGILLGQILGTDQQDRGYQDSDIETRATVRFTLFDARSGKVAWQASSEAEVKMQSFTTAAPAIRDAVKVAVDRIMEGFPE